MKMKMKTVYYLLLGLCLAMAACKPEEPEVQKPEEPKNEIISGTCGENLTWSYNKTKAILTISGMGEMENYSYVYSNLTPAPWFPYQEEIQTVVLGDSVTSIGSSAFYNCSALTQITIDSGVTSIGDYAFGGCSALAGMTVLATVPPTITASTFSNINPQVKVSIPEGSRDAYMADENWKWLLNLSAGELSGICGNNLTWTFTTADCTLTISGTGNMYDYYSGSQPWYNFSQGIKNISISDGVKSIGDYAFSGCSALAEINVLPTVPPAITENTFSNINPQVKVSIPEGSRGAYMADENWKQLLDLSAGQLSGTCGDYLTWTFTTADCTLTISGMGDMYNSEQPWSNFRQGIKNISMLDGMTSIGNQAFIECSALTQVTIPNSVTNIGSAAFVGCSALTQVTIPSSVKSIGFDAFVGCSALTQVTIPNSVTNIGNQAFCYCHALTQVTIGSGVESIGDYVFRGCDALAQITIGNSVKNIGNWAFSGCSALTQVNIPDGVESIGNWAFSDCSALTQVTIGNSVKSIGNYAFFGCETLTQVTIPESVTSIGFDAFDNCSALTQVTIGSGVESIGEYTFYNCSALAEMTVLATVPPTVGSYAFDGVSSEIPVYVPAESLAAYKAVKGWKEFTNLQAIQ